MQRAASLIPGSKDKQKEDKPNKGQLAKFYTSQDQTCRELTDQQIEQIKSKGEGPINWQFELEKLVKIDQNKLVKTNEKDDDFSNIIFQDEHSDDQNTNDFQKMTKQVQSHRVAMDRQLLPQDNLKIKIRQNRQNELPKIYVKKIESKIQSQDLNEKGIDSYFQELRWQETRGQFNKIYQQKEWFFDVLERKLSDGPGSFEYSIFKKIGKHLHLDEDEINVMVELLISEDKIGKLEKSPKEKQHYALSQDLVVVAMDQNDSIQQQATQNTSDLPKPMELVIKDKQNDVVQSAVDYIVHQNKFYQVNKLIIEDEQKDKNGRSFEPDEMWKFCLQIRVLQIDQATFEDISHKSPDSTASKQKAQEKSDESKNLGIQQKSDSDNDSDESSSHKRRGKRQSSSSDSDSDKNSSSKRRGRRQFISSGSDSGQKPQINNNNKDQFIINETLIDYGISKYQTFKDEQIKIDLTSKIYQHIGAHLYFYRQTKDSEIEIAKTSLETGETETVMNGFDIDKKENAPQFLGGIFGDLDVMKQSRICFGCQTKQIQDIDKTYSLMVFYEKEADRSLDLKLVVGKELKKVEIKKLISKIKPQTQGVRVALGIFDQRQNDEKESDKQHDIIVIKTQDQQLELTHKDQKVVPLQLIHQQSNDYQQKMFDFFNQFQHQIYYISDISENWFDYDLTTFSAFFETQKLKIERRSLKLDESFSIIMQKVFLINKGSNNSEAPDIEDYVINVLVLLEKNEMIIQFIHKQTQTNPQKVFKTVKLEQDEFRLVKKWIEKGEQVNLLAKSLYKNPKGIKQYMPQFSNAIINNENKLCIEDSLCKEPLKRNMKEIEKLSDQKKLQQEPQNQSYLGSRRITLDNDNRTVIPILVFDYEKQKIYIKVKKLTFEDGKDSLQEEIIQFKGQIEQQEQRMKLCQSSAIEYDVKQDTYKQNFQLCKQIKEEDGMLSYEIKEFQHTWQEKQDPVKDKSKFNFEYIAIKILIQRQKIDNTFNYDFNFLPFFEKNEEGFDTCKIIGTQLIPSKENYEHNEKEEYHVILKNLDFRDFQFKGEILNSGFKFYRNQQNFMDTLFLLIECEMSHQYDESIKYLEDNNKKDQDNEKIELSSFEKNIVFYEQITVIMNIIPKQRFSDQPNLQFREERFDIFSPLEYLDGNSLCDYMIYEPVQIGDQIQKHIEKQQEQKDVETETEPVYKGIIKQNNQSSKTTVAPKSLIRRFVLNRQCDCKQERLPLKWKEQLPNKIQVQEPLQILKDLTFNNPLNRSLEAGGDNEETEIKPIETSRLLIRHIFDCELNESISTQLEKRILMQAVRQVLKEQKAGYAIEEFEKFFRSVDTKYSFFFKIEQRKDLKLPTTLKNSPKVTILKPQNDEMSIDNDIEELVSQQLLENQDKAAICKKHNGEAREHFAVDTFTIDFEPLITQTQIDILHEVSNEVSSLKKKDEFNSKESMSYFDEMDLAELVADINEFYGKDIKRQHSIKALIEFYFNNKSQNFFKRQLSTFIIQVILYFIQLTCFNFTNVQVNKTVEEDEMGIFDNQKFIIRGFSILLLLFTIYFILIELKQFRSCIPEDWRKLSRYGCKDTIYKYFDRNNIRDTIMASFQIYVFVYRAICPINTDETQRMIFSTLNVVLIMLVITKVFFYLKIFQEYSVINNLIIDVFKEVLPFLSIFMVFTLFFALQYYILGGEYDTYTPNQLKDMYSVFAAFFNSYEISTGETNTFTNPENQPVETTLIWFFWLGQQIMMTIILLNFLIALISQKYEESIVGLQITQTNHKADLNKEYFISQKEKEIERGRIFILQMRSNQDQDDNEWNGISMQIQNKCDDFSKEIIKAVQAQDRKLANYQTGQDKMLREIEGLSALVKEQIKQIQKIKYNQ